MKWLVQWYVNTVFNGSYKGAKDIETGTIEEAIQKCQERVVNEDMIGWNPARIKILNVSIYKEN